MRREPSRAGARLAAPDAGLSRKIATGLQKIGLSARQQAWRRASARGLSPTQGQILDMLRESDGLRLGQIAARLAVTAATASDSVAVLVEKGLVVRRREPADRRAARFTLTPAGRRGARESATWPDFLTSAVDVLDRREQETLLAALTVVIRTLQVRGQIPVARICVTCRFFTPFAHSDPAAPHHCGFVDAPFGQAGLRLDCADHAAVDRRTQAAHWARFRRGLQHPS